MRVLYLFMFFVLSAFSSRAQAIMKNADNSNASLTMSQIQYLGTYPDYIVRTYTNSAQAFTGNGYSSTELYNHNVMWDNSSKWEFTSQSGTDVSTKVVRASNNILVRGDGVSVAGGNTFYTYAQYPSCEGWTNGLKMTGFCIPAVKLTTLSPLGAYNGTVMIIKRTTVPYPDYSIAYPVNGKPRYVGLYNTDSLQLLYVKDAVDPNKGNWLFQVKPSSSSAAWNARVSATVWTTLATNTSDTPLAPQTGWGSSMSLDGSSSPLPVSLVSFSAKSVENKTVQIKWETSEETNAAYFAVERSRDLKTFTEIGRKEASVHSSIRKTYEIIDNEPSFGTNYYRLRQVDLDNKFQLYRIVSAVVDDKNQPFGVFPNPASPAQFSLKVENANEATVLLYDIMGRKFPVVTEKESDHVLIIKPGGRLQPGIYTAQVKNIAGTYTHKLLIK